MESAEEQARKSKTTTHWLTDPPTDWPFWNHHFREFHSIICLLESVLSGYDLYSCLQKLGNIKQKVLSPQIRGARQKTCRSQVWISGPSWKIILANISQEHLGLRLTLYFACCWLFGPRPAALPLRSGVAAPRQVERFLILLLLQNLLGGLSPSWELGYQSEKLQGERDQRRDVSVNPQWVALIMKQQLRATCCPEWKSLSVKMV